MPLVDFKIPHDHIPIYRYQLYVSGIPWITFISISGIENQLEVIELPDGTRSTLNREKAFEIKAQTPQHDRVSRLIMEGLYLASKHYQDINFPFKWDGFLSIKTLSGNSWVNLASGASGGMLLLLSGCFVSGREFPDYKMDGPGEMAVDTWIIQCDSVRSAEQAAVESAGKLVSMAF